MASSVRPETGTAAPGLPLRRGTGPGGKITVDDLRRRAESVQELAKEDARDLAAMQGTQVIVAGVVAVAVLFSVAYFMGSRSGRAKAQRLARKAADAAAKRAAADKAAADASIVLRF